MSRSPGLSLVFPSIGKPRFLDRYWPGRSASSRGSVARLGGLRRLATIGGVFALLGRARVRVKASLPGRQNEVNELDVDAHEAMDLYDAGATIACNAVHLHEPAVARWTAAIARDLGVAVATAGCNLYLSPPGRGLAMHFDDHEVIVVQLAGEKRWRVAPNRAVAHPLQNSGRVLSAALLRYATAAPPLRMPRAPVVRLAPGGALFIPRGAWHATVAGPKAPSISLSFGFRTPTWRGLVCDALADRLALDPRWREPAWGTPREVAARWAVRREQLVALLADLDLDPITTRRPRAGNGRAPRQGR